MKILAAAIKINLNFHLSVTNFKHAIGITPHRDVVKLLKLPHPAFYSHAERCGRVNSQDKKESTMKNECIRT
ncbi:hypothetical protein Ahy_B07g087058 isoform B [Arachis hypogaea]|uniref:Uncharacterized protein n=1 Tax=Arachis hypogaea TaxID=3818 RepID=A0A444YB44_ARAHY|nr:hypothetical protein Ahy_B07g087058 isoform B [Arachis hypogaea]